MPVADVTYHSTDGITVPRYGALGTIGLFGPQVGDSQQLDFTGALIPNGAAAAAAVVAVILPDADCRIAVGPNAAATLGNSRRIKANVPEAVYVPAGARLSVRAA